MLRIMTCTGLLLLVVGFAYAQDPVKWSTSVKKIDAKTFEVHLMATMDAGWHIYAQKQPKESINIPTRVAFQKNPLILLNGPVAEIGNKLKYKNQELGLEDLHYEGKVEFVQKLTLKAAAKTSLLASVEYQACTNERCLPPQTIPVTIILN